MMAQTRSRLNNACSALQHGMQGTKHWMWKRCDVDVQGKAEYQGERERDRFVNRHVHVRGSLVDNASGWMLSSDCAMAKSEWPDL